MKTILELTELQKEALMDRYREGVPLENLVTEFDVSKSTIYNLRAKLKVKREIQPIYNKPQFTLEIEKDICDLYITGSKTKDLAKKYCVATITIRRCLVRNNIPIRPCYEEYRVHKTPEDCKNARKEYVSKYYKDYRLKNKEERLQKNRKYREENAHKIKFQNIYSKYKLTEDEYNQILEVQNNACPICGEVLDMSNSRKIHVDHCHTSKKVRGILHGKCNRLLGMVNDNTQILENAIKYLKSQ